MKCSETDSLAAQSLECFACNICMALFHVKCVRQAFMGLNASSKAEKVRARNASTGATSEIDQVQESSKKRPLINTS
jgi:succinate dehydrogenase/fumarate reductase-like Fe-S protein